MRVSDVVLWFFLGLGALYLGYLIAVQIVFRAFI